MNIVQKVFAILALSMLGAAWAGPIPESQDSMVGLLSSDLPSEQKGRFEVSFDATPLADKIDSFAGLSTAAPGTAADVAAMVRFNDTGTIDARNGGFFRADQSVAYAAKRAYRVRMVVDVASKTYSVFVTPPDLPEVAVAKNYAFRSTQSAAASLGKWVLAGFTNRGGYSAGPLRVSGVSLKAVSSP